MSGAAPAQTATTSPNQKPRPVKQELKKAYVQWIDEVDPILTQAERDAWKKLRTDDEREKFIEDFWRSRDPDPDTEENEFKQEYYERQAYANEHFSSGKPGRLTDRGRIYIKFGKPDEVESHPAGGSYDRPANEGGGSTSTYPFEKWFYRYIPGVRNGIELEFVDPTGSGEYRLARNPDEKDALLSIPGAGPTFAELAGLETRADRLANLGGFGRVNYSRAQDGKELSKQAEDWRQINDAGQRLTLTRLIDTRYLTPGEYRIQINIHDRVSGQTLSSSAKFTVVQ